MCVCMMNPVCNLPNGRISTMQTMLQEFDDVEQMLEKLGPKGSWWMLMGHTQPAILLSTDSQFVWSKNYWNYLEMRLSWNLWVFQKKVVIWWTSRKFWFLRVYPFGVPWQDWSHFPKLPEFGDPFGVRSFWVQFAFFLHSVAFRG